MEAVRELQSRQAPLPIAATSIFFSNWRPCVTGALLGSWAAGVCGAGTPEACLLLLPGSLGGDPVAAHLAGG